MIVLEESTLRKNVAELLVVRASGHAYDSQLQYPKKELMTIVIAVVLILVQK